MNIPALVAALLLAVGCASSPPPASPTPLPTPAAETSPAPPVEPPAPVAEQTPADAEPECQTADDCKKLHDPATGMQWVCENARCLEQALPEPPKAEEAPQPASTETAPKKKGKSSSKKK